MRRKSVLLAVGLLVAAAVVTVAAAGLVLKHEPAFYARAGDPPGVDGAETAARLLTRFQELKNDIRLKSTWGATVSADELNCFFLENLGPGGAMAGMLPDGLHSPRVVMSGDRVRLGMRYGSGFWSAVVWVELRAWLVRNEPNVVALEVGGIKAGAFPVSCQSLLDALSEAARESNVEVTWYRNREDNPVGVFRFMADQIRPTTQILALQVGDGKLTVGGRSQVDTVPVAAIERD